MTNIGSNFIIKFIPCLTGTSFLSVDIGGVYVHTSGYDYHEGKLHQVLIPSSQPISDSTLS